MAGTSEPRLDFDAAWARLESLKQVRPPAGADRLVLYRTMTENARKVRRQAWDIFEEFPTDPRRWNAAVEIVRSLSGYIYDVVEDPANAGSPAFLRDTAARDAWTAYTDALYAQLLNAPDVPEETVKAGIAAYFQRLNMTPDSKSPAHRAVLDEYARRFPDEEKLAGYEQRYYERLQRESVEAAAAHLQRMRESSNDAVRAVAESLSRIEIGREIEMRFTALDGREVDVARMRGKVVLVDFWATWCGPCIQELPNVKAVYERYHAQGFEIIGISLDTERDRQKLIDFCRENDLPWPQHFDGLGWKNQFAQEFSIKGIPAMLLIDRDGRIASSNARGSKLESEVKRLLGL